MDIEISCTFFSLSLVRFGALVFLILFVSWNLRVFVCGSSKRDLCRAICAYGMLRYSECRD